jgi:hypothetical protein
MSEVMERPPTMTVDKMIEDFVKLRIRKKEVEDRHTKELEPFNKIMSQLQGWLLEFLNQTGQDSAKTRFGTAYKSTKTSAVVRDWPATLAFIRENDLWDLLEARVAKTAAFDVINETKEPIPGVETSSEVVCNVRKAGEKPASSK